MENTKIQAEFHNMKFEREKNFKYEEMEVKHERDLIKRELLETKSALEKIRNQNI